MSDEPTPATVARRMVMAGVGLSAIGLAANATASPARAEPAESESKPGARSPVFSVLDFGAVAKADVDNFDAIQRTIDKAAGKGVVLFPPGDYGLGGDGSLARVLRTPAGTRMAGYGATLHRLPGGTAMLMNWAYGDRSTTGYDGWGDIHISGLTWDAHCDTVSYDANILSFDHARNITCVDMTFRRTKGYHAVEYNAVNGGVIERCRFEGFIPVNGGSRITQREAIQIDVANPGDGGAPDKTMAKNITIRDCIFTPYYEGGVEKLPAHATAIGSHSKGAAGDCYENINVLDCYFEGATTRGIGAYYWRGSTIRGCVLRDIEGDAIRGIVSDSLVVADCYIENTKYQAVNLTTRTHRSSIVGCTAVNTGSSEFDDVGPDRPNWPQMDQVGSGKESFFIGVDSTSNLITRCISSHSGGHGIRVNGATGTLLTDNVVVGSTEAPFSVHAQPKSITSGTSLTGNKYIADDVQPADPTGVVVHADAVGTWVFGNDFLGLQHAFRGGPVDTSSNRL